MRRTFSIFVAITTALVITLISACANTDASFEFGWTYETNRIVNVSGEANKHVGGEQSTFDVKFNNLDTDSWQVPYCIVLVDEEQLISVFYEAEIDLEPGEMAMVSASGTFPQGPVGKRYGIRFVVPGQPIAEPSSVWSGNNDLHRSADWFEVSDCSPPA